MPTPLSIKNMLKKKWKVTFQNVRTEVHTEYFVLERTARAYAKHIDSVFGYKCKVEKI